MLFGNLEEKNKIFTKIKTFSASAFPSLRPSIIKLRAKWWQRSYSNELKNALKSIPVCFKNVLASPYKQKSQSQQCNAPQEAQRSGRRQLDARVLAPWTLEVLTRWSGSSAPWSTTPLQKPARGWFCTWFRKTWFQTLAFPNPDRAVPLESWVSVFCCTWLQAARSEYVQAQTHLPTPAFFLLQRSSLRQLAAVSEALLCSVSVCRSN